MLYYIEYESEEHMLYASEIAKLFAICSKNGNPHTSFISKLLTLNPADHPNSAKYLYKTNYGFSRVYPADYVNSNISYIFASNEPTSVEQYDSNTIKLTYEVDLDGTVYDFSMLIKNDNNIDKK